MFGAKKLRPDTSITGIGQPILVLLIFGIVWSIFGITAGLITMSFFFGIYAMLSLAFMLRTGNPWFLATLIYQVSIAFFIMLAPEIGPYSIGKDNFKPLTLIVIIELAVLAYIIATSKLKWQGREVFELAALHVEDTSDGFTDRPRPLGKIDCRPEDIHGFANFLKSKLIAYPIEEPMQTILIPVMMGHEYRFPLGLSKDYSQTTRIIIGKNGEVSAHVSKKDYLKYKEALSFDALCESLGELFIRFFEYYQKGEEVRILNELSKVRTSLFS